MNKVTPETLARKVVPKYELEHRRIHRHIKAETHAEMRMRIDDAIRRVTAAGERIRERERAAREQAERERIAQVLRERRERLSAPPAPISNVIAFRGKPATTKALKRRRKVLHVDFKRGDTSAAMRAVRKRNIRYTSMRWMPCRRRRGGTRG